ncbi:cupin domain-containing protein [Hymenobacter sp. YC55]|uniref:cupin domain-containing protein n=1 Tax=Hymenobacter sp. YC55 TaxID=3034019 RepID=UPI0023F77111|nr:cupin domain-containing protein [Hymenobacter sp. YC55]MDF7811331.1 cupin domain-containing protein [Hymenobacter sp. YC55]
MQRRSFLQLSLAAPAVAYTAPLALAAAPVDGTNDETPQKGILVRNGDDRTNQPFEFLDATFTVKVSAKDTQGRCVIFDTLRRSKIGPILHVHLKMDEWFYVLDGEFKFQVGEEVMRLKTGDTMFVPRNVKHAFVKTSEGDARLIVMHQPAGTMEEYFRTASKMPYQRPEARKELAAKNDTIFVGGQLSPD